MTFEARRGATANSAMARRTLALFIVTFWIAQYTLLTAQRLAFVESDTLFMLVPRACVTLIAIGISFALAYLLGRMRGVPARRRIAAAIGLTALAALAHSAANFTTFQIFVPRQNSEAFEWMFYVQALVQWFWAYAAVAAMIYALQFNQEVQDRERRIAELERVAQDAQLRALRYQLNPHFMFNTLNSITALIARNRPREAETMVENLSDFLRTSLTIDPLEAIPLSREIELQSLYLAIEQVRFAERLQIRSAVSPKALDAMVPSLVTQPLIENAIRHAVAATSAMIELAIEAERQGDRLVVTIANTLAADPPPRKRGTGVGLGNVRERLRTHFGGDVEFESGPTEDGRYRVRFSVPFVRGGHA